MGALAMKVSIQFVIAFARLDRTNIWPVILLMLAIIVFLMSVSWVQIRFFQK